MFPLLPFAAAAIGTIAVGTVVLALLGWALPRYPRLFPRTSMKPAAPAPPPIRVITSSYGQPVSGLVVGQLPGTRRESLLIVHLADGRLVFRSDSECERLPAVKPGEWYRKAFVLMEPIASRN